LHPFVQLALTFATACSALGLCVAACQRALAILAGQVRFLRGARSLGAGVMIGAATWAQTLIWPGFPLTARVDLAGAGVALVLALSAGIAACAAYRRAKGGLRWIAGGAILGAGAAASRFVLMASLGSDVEFDDVLISGCLGLSSAGSVAAFALFGRRPQPRGRLAAAACLGLGLTLPAAIGTGAVMIYAPVPGGIATASLVLIAAAAKLGLIALSYWPGRGAASARPATRAQAWRGSSRPSPSRTPAGTGSPRLLPVRSAAGRAAGPPRQALPAD
jgi:NO-binding membrane sensor protein with MHYT domain